MKTWLKHLIPNAGSVLLIALLLFTQNVIAGSTSQQGPQPAVAVQPAAPGAVNSPSSLLFSYQGQLTDAAGNPIPNAALPMTFKLYTVASGGTACWTEEHAGANAVNVQNGLFHVLLGQLTTIPTSCLTGDAYLELIVNGETLSPRELLTSVAFAVEASTVPDGVITTVKIADGAVTSAKIQDGQVTSADIADNTITEDDISDSFKARDADKLDGLDSSYFAAGGHTHDDRYFTEGESDSRFVNASGDGMTGSLTVRGQGHFTRDGAGECCSGGDYTLSVAEDTQNSGKKAQLQFHNGGISEGLIRLDNGPGGRKFVFGSYQTDMDGEFTGDLLVDGTNLYLNGPTGDANLYMDGANDENVVLRSDSLSFAKHLYITPYGGPGRRFEDVLIGGGGQPVNLGVSGNLNVAGSCISGAYVEANLQTAAEREVDHTSRFEQGDVLCWGIDQLELCTTANDRLVQAVADKDGKPIVLGAEKVKVLGPVQRGDILVASDVPGYAMVNNEPRSGSVIAQALENFDGQRGVIKAMIRKW